MAELDDNTDEYRRRRTVFQRALCDDSGALSEAGAAFLAELVDITKFWDGHGALPEAAANYRAGQGDLLKTILNTLQIDPVVARRRLQSRIEWMEGRDGEE